MVSNNDGMVAPTKPFNEYMLVSYLAMQEEKTGTNALGLVQKINPRYITIQEENGAVWSVKDDQTFLF